MTSLRIMLLLVTLAVCYLLFLQTQRPPTPSRDKTALSGDPTLPSTAPDAHSEYKQAMDKAHAAARQMQDQHAEADSL